MKQMQQMKQHLLRVRQL